jgi:mycofactocin system glycosyltransferase
VSALLPGVRVLREGHVVVGGSPWRALVLGPRRAAAVRALLAGDASDAEVVEVLTRHGLATPSVASGRASGVLSLDEVTVVVPVHDDARRLPGALAAVPEGVQVVVVDDGSKDASADVARRLGATVVRHQSPQGPAAARNAGLAAVTTPYVAFVDADVTGDSGWLAALLPQLSQADVALVGPRITALDPHDPHPLARYEAAVSPLDRGPDAAVVEPRGRVDYLPSAALLGRVEALRGLGGFDTSLHLGEDVDLCHRLHDAGWQVRYDPAASVQHDHRTSWAAWLKRRAAYASAAPVVAERHGTPQPPVPAAGAVAALWLLLGPGRLRARAATAGLITAAGAAATARSAARQGVPLHEAAAGGVRRELSGVQRVLGMLPRQQVLPASVVWALVSRRGRLAVPVAVVVQHLKRWRATRPELPPATFVALRVADEAALSVGLWRACWQHRTLRPLLPRLGGPPAVAREDDPQDEGLSPARIDMPVGDGS